MFRINQKKIIFQGTKSHDPVRPYQSHQHVAILTGQRTCTHQKNTVSGVKGM